MTDTSSVVITPSTTESYPVAVPLEPPVLNGVVASEAAAAAAESEEPYTIKCICAYEDDDGSTVLCEACDTWQHIDCYYPESVVPEIHNCVDCEPRYLDGRSARERQRQRRDQSDDGDRKKKVAGKTHKKKPNATGTHHRSDSASARGDAHPSHNHHPAKKVKTAHRASHSLSGLSGGAPALATEGRKRGGSVGHAMSPTKPSGPTIPLYSSEFLHLYERDAGHTDMDSNLFVNLPLATDLASWVTDPAALSRVANGRAATDVFSWSDSALDPSRWPTLSVESLTDSTVDIDGLHPTWKVLKTRDPVRKNEIVGEVKGKIGSLRDYCLDPRNRWQELRHPEPFVFFHPQLPIYIDSRQEGSVLRYIRRSCRPNVTMKTYIANEVEYHFCFVAKDDIPAGAEVTAMWYLDPQLFESSNGIVKQESSDTAQEAAAICISNVLSHFGGCACEPPQHCLLASVDRRRHPKNAEPTTRPPANGKRKKAKTKPTVSPPATGRASTSRAGSETTRNVDDDDQADSRSSSGSVRGATRSRDLTPTMPNAPDIWADTELSARDKRKIAAVEKKFQQLEQGQQLSQQRKKKRPSGPSAQPTPSVATAAQTGYFGNASAAAARQSPSSAPSPDSAPPSSRPHASSRKSSGPSTPTVPSPLTRPNYVECAVQVELEAPEAAASSTSLTPRRPLFMPLTQRLLKRCHEDRVRLDVHIRQLTPTGDSPLGGAPVPGSATPTDGHQIEFSRDVDMPDASPSPGSPGSSGVKREASPALRPPCPPPWPSTAAHVSRIPTRTVNGTRTDLRLSMPPPPLSATAFNPDSATSSATQQSPAFGEPQSQPQPHPPLGPISSNVTPSPVKKKLSLGDYLIRRGTLTTPTTEKSHSPATPTAMSAQKSPSGSPQASREGHPAADGSQPPPSHDRSSANLERSGDADDTPMTDLPEPVPAAAVTSVTSVS